MSPPQSVCIVMLSALGDAVHVLPVVTALKRAWPDTHISWVIQPLPRVLASTHPDVDEFIVFDRQRGLDGVRSLANLKTRLNGRHFDLVLGLQVYMKAGVITGMISADRKLGFDRKRARDLNWMFTTEQIPPHPWQHVQDQYFEFLHYLEVDPSPVEWQLALTPAEVDVRNDFYAHRDRPVAAMVLGTSKPEKNWPADKYARLVDALHSDHGVDTVVVGGPSDLEREAFATIEDSAGATPENALGPNLRKLVALVDGADFVISPDTGPLHIARALETPVIGLYGYTNPKRYGPYKKYEDLVVDGYRTSPDEDYPATPEYRDGMKRISLEDVQAKVDVALERYVRGGASSD